MRKDENLIYQNLQKIANKMHGTLISTSFIGDFSKLLWECKKGHRWEQTPARIKRGDWCPHCRVQERRKKNKLLWIRLWRNIEIYVL